MDGKRTTALVSDANYVLRRAAVTLLLAGAALWASQAQAQVLAMGSERTGSLATGQVLADRAFASDASVASEVPLHLRRQIVNYSTSEPPGTVIVDTPHTYLYFVLGGGRAVRYGIGVGRDGFTWSGTKTIERKSEWPDWLPPADMLQRQPYLPRFMAGGPGNPLGARAMYLSGSVYRIHGTNKPSSIGKHVSSGCIRMLNEDVIDLYGRTPIGTKVVVLPMTQRRVAQTFQTLVPIGSTREPVFAPSLH